LSWIAAVTVLLSCCNPLYALVLAIALWICPLVFSIMYIDLYFQDAIPVQCVDSLMGNNFAYYMMEIKVVLSIVMLSMMALGLLVASCILLCLKLCGSANPTPVDESGDNGGGLLSKISRSIQDIDVG